MEEATTREGVARRGWHDSPCGDLRALQASVEGLAEDRRRLNGSVGQINSNIGSIHEKVNSLALRVEAGFGDAKKEMAGLASADDMEAVKAQIAAVELSVQKTLGNAGWKILAAIFAAGLGFGSALMMLMINRLVA